MKPSSSLSFSSFSNKIWSSCISSTRTICNINSSACFPGCLAASHYHFPMLSNSVLASLHQSSHLLAAFFDPVSRHCMLWRRALRYILPFRLSFPSSPHLSYSLHPSLHLNLHHHQDLNYGGPALNPVPAGIPFCHDGSSESSGQIDELISLSQ